jgi:uncharacterized protein DUF5666
MLDKLALLLKSKIALAAIGATLVAGGGASVAAAATGAQVPLVSQALHAATGTHDANDDKGHDGAAQGTPGADNDANDDHGQDANDNDNDANEHEASGTVSSVDASGSSFVLKESGGTSVTVKASASTIFDGGLTKLGDLKVGMTVEVKGETQADGTVAASRVHGENVNENQGDDHGGSSSGSGSDGSGSGGSGSSGGSSSGGSDDHGGNG